MPVQNVVKHQTEDGIYIRRRKFTRDTYTYELVYDALDEVDAQKIITLFANNNMHTAFDWTDINSVTHSVLFNKEISYVEFVPGWYRFDTFSLIEV